MAGEFDITSTSSSCVIVAPELSDLSAVAIYHVPSRTATFQKTNVASWDEQLALFTHAIATYKHIDIVLPLAESDPAKEENWFSTDDAESAAPPKPDLTPIDVGITGLLYSA